MNKKMYNVVCLFAAAQLIQGPILPSEGFALNCDPNQRPVVEANSGCRSYWICFCGRLKRKVCPPDQLYSEFLGTCDWEELVPHCPDTSVIDEYCSKRFGNFVKPNTNCRRFIRCNNGHGLELECPIDQLFNQPTERCDWKELVKCNETDSKNNTTFPPVTVPRITTVNHTLPWLITTSRTVSISRETLPSTERVTSTSTSGEVTTSLPLKTISTTISTTSVPTTRFLTPSTFTPENLTTSTSSPLSTVPTITTSSPMNNSTDSTLTSKMGLSSTLNKLSTESSSLATSSTTSFPASTTATFSTLTANRSTISSSTSESVPVSTTVESTVISTTTAITIKSEPPIISTTISTTEDSTTTPRGCEWGDPTCPPDKILCPEETGLFSHPDSPKLFIHCDNWRPYIKRCPKGLHFNQAIQVCTWPDKYNMYKILP